MTLAAGNFIYSMHPKKIFSYFNILLYKYTFVGK
jgi:hypothetical protein